MPGKGRPFPKGVRGNPGGRQVLDEPQALAPHKSPEPITLANIMHNDKASVEVRDKRTGRFLLGHKGGGGPSGSRCKLAASFLDKLHQDFERDGEAAIVRMRETDPVAYCKVIAQVLPKQSERTIKHDIEKLSDSELLALVADLRSLTGPAQSAGDASADDSDKTKLN
jgi:hypothetical protein